MRRTSTSATDAGATEAAPGPVIAVTSGEPAGVGPDLAGDEPQQGGLAGAARAHDGRDPTLGDLELET